MIDVPEFREKFPAFANPVLYPTDSILLMADMTDCYIDIANSWFRCVKCQELMTELLTAHLLMINGTTAAPASGATGVISNATVGSVSVGFVNAASSKGAFMSWLGKTPYGEQLAALLARLAIGLGYVGGSPERRAFRKVGGRF